MKKILILVLALALPLVFAGCGDDEEETTRVDPQASADKVDLGTFAAMDALNGDMDFTAAYDLFEEAVRLDPNNMQARAGAGAMNVLRLPNHPMIADLIDTLGIDELLKGTLPWKNLGFGGGRGPAAGAGRAIFGSLTGEMQTDMGMFLDLLLAEIQVSIDYFNAVEGHADFEWLIPMPEGYGMDTLEIDVTDIHFAESPLHFIRALLLGLDAYNLDIGSLEGEDVAAALAQDSDFLTLTNAGALTTARGAMDAGADEASVGAVLLDAEVDDQTNDFVRLLFPGEEFGLWVAMTEGQRDTLENMPAMMDDMMDNPLPMIDDFDNDEVPDTLLVNLGVLFDDPIEDFKAILPEYTIQACGDTAYGIFWAETEENWTWHPEELNGLIALPGGPMTSDAMIQMFGLGLLYYMGGCL